MSQTRRYISASNLEGARLTATALAHIMSHACVIEAVLEDVTEERDSSMISMRFSTTQEVSEDTKEWFRAMLRRVLCPL